jgi:four helix bundle protein
MYFARLTDLVVYNRLCDLHLEICVLSAGWPLHERHELASQVRRSSNSAPAQLAERHADRHLRNKIEGVNRARAESAETIHHLHIAHRKGYLPAHTFAALCERYEECVRMLNALERTLERNLPPTEQRWRS